MKKILAFVMVMAMALSVAACGGKSDNGTSGGSNQSAMEALPEDATPAQTVVADFTDRVNAGTASAEDLANGLVVADYIEFAGATMPVEPGYLNGFSSEITGFKEGYMFGPAIGSIPFIGYVFVLDDASKADDFVKTLEGAADLRWNICTQADEMQSAVAGDKVCFVMSPLSFEE